MDKGNIVTLKLDNKCERCGSYSFQIRKKEPHYGLYCTCCLKWIKWLSKKERNLYLENTTEDLQQTENLGTCGPNTSFLILDDIPFDV